MPFGRLSTKRKVNCYLLPVLNDCSVKNICRYPRETSADCVVIDVSSCVPVVYLCMEPNFPWNALI